MNADAMDSLRSSEWRVLIVGAGGIGCELIKNLCKTKLRLTVMDYDTVAESNLNRQFCYRLSDIGKPKVEVLKSYFQQLNPNLRLTICTSDLYSHPAHYFTQFDVLISALDSHAARAHLNQMAIDNSIPMLDAGTSGFNGQATAYIRHQTECRMCRPQPHEPIDAALCTIRGKPDRNVHCVYFALGVLEGLLGVRSGQEGAGWTRECLAGSKLEHIGEDEKKEFILNVFNYLFYQSVAGLGIPEASPIRFPQQVGQIWSGQILSQLASNEAEESVLSSAHPTDFYAILFCQSLYFILSDPTIAVYDKDIPELCCFVWAVTNLRIINFKELLNSRLKLMSYYECKDLSGHIVPAIASTNSIAAALQVLFLNRRLCNSLKPQYLSIKSYSHTKVEPYIPQKPKLGCPYCSHLYNHAYLRASLKEITWGDLQDYLCLHFQDSLRARDMRCGEFVVLRNAARKWVTNRVKKISDFTNLLQKSTLDGRDMITIRYVPCHELRQYSNWKFTVLDDSDLSAENKIVKQSTTSKQQYQKKISDTVELLSKYESEVKKRQEASLDLQIVQSEDHNIPHQSK